VVCVDCQKFHQPKVYDDRMARGERLTTGENATFYLRNNCPSPNFQTGLINCGTWAAVASIAALVYWLSNQNFGGNSTTSTSFAIAIFNKIFPLFATMLTDLEAHSPEGNKQCSLYFKIALFRLTGQHRHRPYVDYTLYSNLDQWKIDRSGLQALYCGNHHVRRNSDLGRHGTHQLPLLGVARFYPRCYEHQNARCCV
jgi:hypothetical protein